MHLSFREQLIQRTAINSKTNINQKQHMKHYKPILITLPQDLVHDLDQASDALGRTRMALIRRCIIRDLQYVAQHELPKLQQAQETLLENHRTWSLRKINPLR